ncbi:MAG: DUF3375 domain-containing protein [Cyanobacteria bacterium J06634_5]
MDYERIRYEVETSPALKLLKSQNIAFTVSFLYRQFKAAHRVSIAQAELEETLTDYIEYLQEGYADLRLKGAKEYLNDWCNALWLRKTFEKVGDAGDEPVFSLTPDTERAIAWLEDLQQKDDFIGTESRFLLILSLLKEIKEGATADVETRIAQLERDRDRIQQEIDAIREAGEVEAFNETQLRERFMSANSLTRQLMGDFRAVEQNFRDLTRKVQEAQLEKDSRRGTVVGRVLDADEALKESDQGRSFYTFFKFLMSETKQRELKDMITAVYGLESLRSLTKNQGFLRRIVRNLLNSADHIVQSNHRLTEKLRQMLDERNMRENRRVAELITDVQRLSRQAVSRAAAEENRGLENRAPENRPLDEKAFWSLEGVPDINLVMERPLHPLEEREVPTFTNVDFTEFADDALEAELDELAQQFYVDEAALAQRIDRELEDRANISLTELIERYPVTKGLPEVVSYLSLATKFERHSIDASTIDLMTIDGLAAERQLQLKLPRVIFCR